MIVNPFDLSEWQKDPEAYAPLDWKDRNGFVSVQVFKGWKRVDSLIRAIPRMQNNEKKIVGGAGIEYRYMTSYDKCKDKYKEPDGTRIWDNAIRFDMDYVGVIPTPTFYNYLKEAKLQIDPSWSKKYSQYGAHFNRTTVEAMICGAVPVATDLGMINSLVFQAGSNFFQLEHDSSFANYAHCIDYWLSHDARVQWRTIRENNMANIIPHFGLNKVIPAYENYIKHGESNHAFSRQTHLRYRSADYDSEAYVNLLQASNKNLQFFGIR